MFFTVVTFNRRPVLANQPMHEILRDIWTQSSSRNGWWVGDYIIMPDHLHFFARPSRTAERMQDWVKLWKSLSSRRAIKALGLEAPIWQEEYFDRYLRSSESYAAKWAYVERNALDGQLVARVEDWLFRGRVHTLTF